MNDSAQSYDFSQQAAMAPPRIRTGLRITVGIVAVLCLTGILFRRPLADFTGSFLVPEPPPEPSAEIILPAGLSEEERLMYTLTHVGGTDAREAVRVIEEKNDPRYVAVLIEALITNEVGSPLQPTAGTHHYFRALTNLTGDESLRPDSQYDAVSRKFMEWYARTDLTPPPGFVKWKSNLLKRIDPTFSELIYEGVPSRIRLEEVRPGGVVFDGIPALDNPRMIAAETATFLKPEEPVFGIVLNGEARAYPDRILQWHEMANDVIGGVPVSLAYCTLCGSAIAYDGRRADGEDFTFGSSGLLYRSNKLMYDRQTRSLWNHLTGEPVIGELAESGSRLELLPVVVTTWGEWKERYPDSQVASLDTGFQRAYHPGAAYGSYFKSDKQMFPVGIQDNRLPLKSRVYGLNIEGESRAYPLGVLANKQVVNDSLGGQPVVLVATRDTIIVDGRQLMTSTISEPVTFDAGGEVRVFQRGEQTFRPGPDADTLLDQNGRQWTVAAGGLVPPEGKLLARVNGVQSFWFAWYQFHEDTGVYSPGEGE